MQGNLKNITVPESLQPSYTEESITDYRYILDNNGLGYKISEYYLLVGEIRPISGWIFHISVIRTQFASLLDDVIPILVESSFSFKIAMNSEIVKLVLDGGLGITQIGKLITIYPESDSQAVAIAKKIVYVTQEFRGPAVHTDQYLGGALYTRYHKKGLESNDYTIPFQIPIGVKWPFSEIVLFQQVVHKQLWNYKYKPLEIIKPDFKGNVIKGNYFKGFLNIKLCLIKEGVKNMWTDDSGRDIVDRLLWQYDLYKCLAGKVSTPKIFDLFEEGNNTYLVMEFVKGRSLNHEVASIYNEKNWFLLSAEHKRKLTTYFLKVLVAIEQLHNNGYVHRDITPANFIISKKGELFLIDMELSYSFLDNNPTPPFRQGTPGFMSPEQLKYQTPTPQEDIYALGALMIYIFTGFFPNKIDISDKSSISDQLDAFTESHKIKYLIEKCLSRFPSERPSLQELKQHIENYRKEIDEDSTCKWISKNSVTEKQESLKSLINEAIVGLTSARVFSSKKLWKFPKSPSDVSQSWGRILNPGLQTGMAGVLYFLARAKRSGYNINACLEGYMESWKYLIENYITTTSSMSTGMYNGLIGIALAINEGIISGLLSKELYKSHLQNCFQFSQGDLDLATGIAGKGAVLLQCKKYIDQTFYQSLLNQYANALISLQQPDGSWNVFQEGGKQSEKIIGLSNGVAGIVNFLIAYSNGNNDTFTIVSIQKGLNWLYKARYERKNKICWGLTSKSRHSKESHFEMTSPKIALVFIRAYERLGNPLYKKIAEKVLLPISPGVIHHNFTQMNGLAGLGEIYLEALRVFKVKAWQERVDWLALVFSNTSIYDDQESRCWSLDAYNDWGPGLMNGICGILHFLIRYQNPENLDYILLSHRI